MVFMTILSRQPIYSPFWNHITSHFRLPLPPPAHLSSFLLINFYGPQHQLLVSNFIQINIIYEISPILNDQTQLQFSLTQIHAQNSFPLMYCFEQPRLSTHRKPTLLLLTLQPLLRISDLSSQWPRFSTSCLSYWVVHSIPWSEHEASKSFAGTGLLNTLLLFCYFSLHKYGGLLCLFPHKYPPLQRGYFSKFV